MAQWTSPLRAHARCISSSCPHARPNTLLRPGKTPKYRLQYMVHDVPSVIPDRLERLQTAARDDVQPVPDLMIAPSDWERDRTWIAGMISLWLDEEWTPLEVHQQLGKAAGDAYVRCRQQGVDDMSSLVLGLSNELLAFNYRETFTSAFEVANKVVEMLMMRTGVDVCCTDDQDVARLERYDRQQEAEGQQ